MTSENVWFERPMTDPERLRAVADWLDITDPMVAAYMRTQPESEERERALECVEGAEMQADLRKLADDLEAEKVRDRGDTDAIEAFNHPHPGAKGQPVIHRHAWGLTPHSHILRAVCCEPECLEFPTHNIHPIGGGGAT